MRWAERRSSLSTPEKWVIDWVTGGRRVNSGVTVTEKTAMYYSAYFACVRIISQTVASLPLHIYRRLERGKEKAVKHPLYRLLHTQPNEEMTAFNFWEMITAHAANWGNGYAEIEYNNAGIPVALWPLTPDKVRPKRNEKTRELEYEITLPDNSGKTITLRNVQVFHLPGFGFDGRKGYSIANMAMEAVGLGMAAEEFAARFFGQGANASGIVEYPAKLSDSAFERYKKTMEQKYQGLSRSHRVIFLEEGLKFHQLTIPPEAAQMLESRKFQIADIARYFGVPLHKIQDLEKATFSNIEEQNIEFVVDLIRPWCVRIEQVIQIKLIDILKVFFPKDEYFAKFNVDGLLRGDIKSRYEAYAIGRQWGWLSANDVRELEDMNAIENGDQYLVPLNMVPADLVTKAQEPGDEGRQVINQLKEIRAKRSASTRRNTANAYKRIFKDAALRVIKREEADIMRKARKLLGSRSLDEFNTWLSDFYRDHEEFVKATMSPVFLSYAESVQADVADEINSEAGMTPELESFTSEYVGTYANRHTGQSVTKLRDAMDKAEEEGADQLETLQNTFDDWKENRTEAIAQEETNRANNAVAKQVYLAGGILAVRWAATGESCPYCKELDGRVVDIHSFFVGEGEELNPDGGDGPLIPSRNIGHPPLHSGCDCMLVTGL